jgi:replicative DNA helicase
VLREYQYRGIEFDVIMCDYVTIMKPEKAGKGELYKDGKSISEELRALSGEFNAPVVSVTQLNRSGIEIDFREVDLVHIGESLGISATCDFLAIMGRNNEDLIYESELHYKIVKNRMGGRVNEVGKFYIDKKCLKMYDESELDVWLMDEKATGDTRVVKNSY